MPSSDGPSGQTGGTPARIGRRSCGSAPPHSESSPLPAALYLAWALASESRPGAPAPVSAYCRRPPQLAPGASCANPLRGQEPPPWGGARPGLATPLRSGSPRWHWLPSRLLLAAWPPHHRLTVLPPHIYRDPRGLAPSAPPFFCGFFGPIQQYLISVDPLQGFIALGQLLPCEAKG